MKGDLDKRKKRKGQSDEMEEFRWIENKKPKLEETSRGAGDESENNINGLNNGNDEGAKMSLKEAEAMSGKWLRKSFNSSQGLDALRKFLVVHGENKERDLAADYLRAGGNLLEIVKLLDTGDKKNVNDAADVFAGMRLIICEILAEFPEYRSNAEEACRHLINARLSFVHGMLSSRSNAKHRKVVLRLLASMVRLGGNLPRELLAHLSFHSQVLETLSQRTKPSDGRDVRSCYINFVLAFLVEGKPSTIRALLDKRAMLSCIFSELMYDSPETVHLVLDTVKTWVLENPAISKTTKLHVFSTPVLRSIVSLYNWKGPKNWPGLGGKKRDRTAAAAANDFVDPQGKKIAVKAVENFLTTLLTSNRHGVIFHDRSLGTSGRKYNQLVNTVLQSLERPWEHAKPAELVIKILTACPDLVRAQLVYTEPFLEPRASKKWILAMRFVGRLIESIDPDNCLAPCLSQLLPAQLVTAVENLTMPALVLKSAIRPSLDNEENLVIRHEGVCLLKKMLKRARIFSDVVEKESDRTDWLIFRNSMLDYVSKNVPSLEKMLRVWNLAVTDGHGNFLETRLEEELRELIPSKLEHFNAILDLIEAHRKICPELQTAAVDLSACGELRTEIILAGLEKYDETEEKDVEGMKIKATRLLLSVDVAAFDPNKSLFGTTVRFLLRNTEGRPEGNETESQRRETVKILLNSCGLFEACQDEIDIWIENIGDLDNAFEKNLIAHWFVEILEKAMKNADKYLDAVVEAEEAAAAAAGKNILGCDEKLGERFDQLTNEKRSVDILQPRRINVAPIVSISPVLCSAIENAPTNSDDAVIVGKYLSLVLIEILHCQVNPGTLVQLTRKLDNFPAKKYLNSWLAEGGGEPRCCMKKRVSPPRYVRSRKLSKILLLSEEEENNESRMIDRMKQIFQGSRQQIEFVYGEKRETVVLVHDFDRYDVHRLLTMTLFYLSQFIQRGQLLSHEKFNSHKMFIIALLHAAKSIGGTTFLNKCSSLVFEHPSILQYFTPLCPTNSNVEIIITGGMMEIFKTATRLTEPQCLPALFSSFKNKLLGQLFLAIRECEKGKIVKQEWSFPVELMAIVEPTSSEVVDLLGRIINHLPKSMFLMEKNAGLSVWANLVPKLMEILTMRKTVKSPYTSSSIVDANVVKKIIHRLIQFKTYPHIRTDLWEIHLQRYLESFPHLIAAIDAHAFNRLLEGRKNTTTINLISFLAGRNDQFILLFVKYISNDSNALAKSDLVFPIMASRLSYSWNDAFLTKIYNRYRNDLIRYFGEPEESPKDTWISGNIRVAARLIDSCFGEKDCEEARARVLSNGDKLDNVDLGYIKLVKNLFEKSWKLVNESRQEPLTELIQVLMRITVCALKKDSKNEEKLETLCQSLTGIIESLKSKRSDFIHQELSKNYWWPQFTRFSLKLGSKVSKEENKHSGKWSLLQTLVSLCEIAYKDGSEDQYVKTLFEMTISHWEFVNTSSQNIQRDLAQLVLCLIRKNPGTMTSSQIPLYLAAYNATLSETDQLILLILQHYRANKIKFNEYRPYLWGEAAASHYSVKGEADTALWRQPSVSQVLDLFDRHLVEETIKRFPVDRDLEPSEVCAADAKVYDPSFYLPLLAHLLSDNNVVACHKVTQSGALALVLAALGGTRAEIRLAACNVLHRFSFHLEATGSKEKYVWIRLIDKVRSGIVDTNTLPGDFRPSCLVSTFLARAALVTTQPGDILYPPIQAFLTAKPTLEFNAIPELLQLFHSSDVEHVAHRHWILRVIRDGMKTQLDTEVALKSVVFKMLLDFHSSLLADPTTKRLVLEIIESTVKIPKAGSLLTRSYGLLAWLSQVSSNLTSHDADAVRIIVATCREIFKAVTRSNDRDRDSQFLLLNVLKNVGSCLTKNTSVVCFDNYTSALSEIFQTKSLRAAGPTRQDLRQLVKIGKQIYGQETAEIEDILDSFDTEAGAGAAGAAAAAAAAEWLKFRSTRTKDSRMLEDRCSSTSPRSIGVANLRNLVLTWCGYGPR